MEDTQHSNTEFHFDRLLDPLGDRVVKSVPLPPARPLSITQAYPQYIQFGDLAKPNAKIIRECLILDGKLDKKAYCKLISDCKNITKNEPNLVKRAGEVAIIGDIHGQFYDMVSMLDKMTPRLEEEDDFGLLFLGDYVDRGILCVEVIAYLTALKINYPSKITLLRGNHESRSMTSYFTFRQECIDKYDIDTYDQLMEFFDTLPLASTVNDLYLCLHGGISPDLVQVSDVETKIDRFQEPPNVGLFCDLLWSDPVFETEYAQGCDYVRNEARDCSFHFGLRPVKNLLRKDRLLTLVRAHEVQQEGYNMYLWEGEDAFPLVITIFSAPNYCGSYQNRAAIAISKANEDESLQIKQFDPSTDLAKPYQLPQDMDVLTWSAPFLCDCVSKMFYQLLSHSTTIYKAEDENVEALPDAEVTELLSRR